MTPAGGRRLAFPGLERPLSRRSAHELHRRELIPARAAHRRYPWDVVALERPELIALIAELVARGQLATAVARELHARGWIDDEDEARRPAPADAIHRRFVSRRAAIGPYAPYASVTSFCEFLSRLPIMVYGL